LNLIEFSEENIYDNQLECLTLFNFDQLSNPHPNFKHYFEDNQINFQKFFLFWNKEDLELIKNSLLENTLIDMKETINDYSALLQQSSYKKSFNYEKLKKAFIYMNSQNFKINIQHRTYHAMLPFLDIYEIYPETNVDWSSDLMNFNDTMKLYALNDIKKGDALITNYGEMDNGNLLINFGFTIENNQFPIDSEFFIFKYEGHEYPIVLKQNCTKDIFYNLKKIRADKLRNKVKKAKSFSINKSLNEDLKIFQEMIKQLTRLSNKQRLRNLLNNLNKTPNAENISRALQAEDILIDVNLQNIAEIIQLLNGNTEIDKKLKERKIYLENKSYFDFYFARNTNNNINIEKDTKVIFELNNIL